MRLMFDLFTIAVFFVTYKIYGMYAAVASAMGLYSFQIIMSLKQKRKIEPMQWVTLGLILCLGGATLLFHNETFFKWKPTAVYWLFAISLFCSRFFSNEPLLRKMIGQQLELSDTAWHMLQTSWTFFFIIMGAANLYVAYNFSTDTWVNFKLFGLLGITLVFVVLQGVYISWHLKKIENNT